MITASENYALGWSHEIEKARHWLRSQSCIVLATKAIDLLKAPAPEGSRHLSYVSGRKDARARLASWLDERGHHALAASIRDLQHKGVR